MVLDKPTHLLREASVVNLRMESRASNFIVCGPWLPPERIALLIVLPDQLEKVPALQLALEHLDNAASVEVVVRKTTHGDVLCPSTFHHRLGPYSLIGQRWMNRIVDDVGAVSSIGQLPKGEVRVEVLHVVVDLSLAAHAIFVIALPRLSFDAGDELGSQALLAGSLGSRNRLWMPSLLFSYKGDP